MYDDDYESKYDHYGYDSYDDEKSKKKKRNIKDYKNDYKNDAEEYRQLLFPKQESFIRPAKEDKKRREIELKILKKVVSGENKDTDWTGTRYAYILWVIEKFNTNIQDIKVDLIDLDEVVTDKDKIEELKKNYFNNKTPEEKDKKVKQYIKTFDSDNDFENNVDDDHYQYPNIFPRNK